MIVIVIVIVEHVTLKDGEGSMETVVKTAEGIQQDIERAKVRYEWWSLIRLLITLQQSCQWDDLRGHNEYQRSDDG